jgi:hypothetical protein
VSILRPILSAIAARLLGAEGDGANAKLKAQGKTKAVLAAIQKRNEDPDNSPEGDDDLGALLESLCGPEDEQDDQL